MTLLDELAEQAEAATWADPALARKIAEALERSKGHRIRDDWNPLAFLDEAVTIYPRGKVPPTIPSNARICTASALRTRSTQEGDKG